MTTITMLSPDDPRIADRCCQESGGVIQCQEGPESSAHQQFFYKTHQTTGLLAKQLPSFTSVQLISSISLCTLSMRLVSADFLCRIAYLLYSNIFSGVLSKLIALFLWEWKMKWLLSKRDNKQGFSDMCLCARGCHQDIASMYQVLLNLVSIIY